MGAMFEAILVANDHQKMRKSRMKINLAENTKTQGFMEEALNSLKTFFGILAECSL